MRTPWCPAVLVCLAALSADGASAGGGGVLLRLGDRAVSAVTPAGDVDTYVFDAPAGTRARFSLEAGPGELRPELELLGPAGAPVDPGDRLRSKAGRITWKGLLLPATGRYTLRVAGRDDTAGAYELRTKGRIPRTIRTDPITLGPGGTAKVNTFGDDETRWKVRIARPEGTDLRVLSVLDPEARKIAGGSEAFGPEGGKRRGTVYLRGGFGTYGLVLGGASATITFEVAIRVLPEKLPRRTLLVDPEEPRPGSVSPSSGPPGFTVHVLGTGFHEGCGVRFAGIAARFTIRESGESLLAGLPGDLPPGAPLTVSARNPDGQENAIEDAFTVILPPAVCGVAPSRAAPGDTVSIVGARFRAGASARFGAVVSPDTRYVNQASLSAVVPPSGLPEGPADLVVSNPDGLSARQRDALVVEALPLVTSVHPATARPGESVRIQGANFRAGCRVFFADREAEAPDFLTQSVIETRVPATGLPAGPVDVIVVKPFGSRAVLLDGLTVLAEPDYRGLLITGIVDGPRTGGLPKAVEITATADLPDLDAWGIGIARNGAAFTGPVTMLAGSAKAGDRIHASVDADGFRAYFGYDPDFTISGLTVNGNDAVALYRDGELVDVYGNPGDVEGGDDHSAAWDYRDSYAYRKDGTGPDTTFDERHWEVPGRDLLDRQGTSGKNGDAGITVPFGTWFP